ncbi:MAG: hypothetical protein JXB85_11490, partial [Anaerolineales bacterium]|nr:hypothetical protein [Anaerolineales bacterium]
PTQPPPTQPPPTSTTGTITICHCTSPTNCITITVSDDGTYGGHANHPYDIIPAPPGGCP